MGKRARAPPLALGVPLQTMLNVVAERTTDADDEPSHTARVADLHKYDDVGSVYGTLVSEFDFQPDLSKEAVVQIQYINPFALLHWLGAKALPFLLFLRSCLAGMEGQMIFYADEVTPGNNKRHDEGRKYVAMYWSLVEFPDLVYRTACSVVVYSCVRPVQICHRQVWNDEAIEKGCWGNFLPVGIIQF